MNFVLNIKSIYNLHINRLFRTPGLIFFGCKENIEGRMGGTFNTYGESINAHPVLIAKSEGKSSIL
jgi:hypothetical protein